MPKNKRIKTNKKIKKAPVTKKRNYFEDDLGDVLGDPVYGLSYVDEDEEYYKEHGHYIFEEDDDDEIDRYGG